MDFKAMAQAVQPEVVAFRRDLHEHPEASFEEFRTTDQIAKEMDKLGIPYRRFEPTGLIAEIKGGKPGKTIALRADIDALSITEKTGLPFASKNEGFMHACGHDTHAAMLVGAAKVLMQIKDQLCGTVKLLFQPAEEIGRGAKAVIKQHGLDGVDFIFGIHIGAMMDVGTISMMAGASSAATDRFTVKVTGKATHGARPENGIDATVAAAAIVMNLQPVVSREVAATTPLVVTVGSLHSGSRFNIVSGEAILEGTIRSYDVDLHHQLPSIIERVVKNTAAAYRCEAEVEYDMLTEVLVNDPDAIDLVHASALKVVDDPAKVVQGQAGMGGEDFSEYTVLAKAAFARLGAGGEFSNHSDYVVFDEDSFPTGVALHCQVVWDFLNGGKD